MSYVQYCIPSHSCLMYPFSSLFNVGFNPLVMKRVVTVVKVNLPLIKKIILNCICLQEIMDFRKQQHTITQNNYLQRILHSWNETSSVDYVASWIIHLDSW